jgi:hypothetical protein
MKRALESPASAAVTGSVKAHPVRRECGLARRGGAQQQTVGEVARSERRQRSGRPLSSFAG